MTSDELYRCRLCGCKQLEPPWEEDGESASFRMCPCCATEFGYEDNNMKALIYNRKIWVEGGMKWFLIDEKPIDYDPIEQMKHIPKKYKPSLDFEVKRKHIV